METVIQAEHLRKAYGNVKAVSDVSVTVNRGEIFGLLGANGAGKSTTLECMLGTKKPDGGKVSILGMDPKTDRKKLFERVSVQFQDGSYQDRITVRELCEVTRSLYKNAKDYRSLLKEFGLSEKLSCAISELSGGQRQRLFIVLALIPDPEVVFLDELTTGLDARARHKVWNCLTALKENGLTILLTSHFMDEVKELCDKISIMKDGQIIFHGTVGEAVKQSPCDTFEDAYLWFTDEEGEQDESI